MAALRPTQQHVYSQAEAQSVMAAARAAYKPEYSREGYFVYLAADRRWLTAEPVGGGRFRVSIYSSCPCQQD
jgi:hypothetical protein